MVSFNYFTPTEIIFGAKKELEVASLIKKYKGNRVLIHYGGKSALKSGLIDSVKSILNEAEIEYHELSGVVPNPHLSLVRKGIEICKDNKIDFILAVGGGSVIDSAKAIAAGAKAKHDVWDFFTKEEDIKKALPVGTILTLAAAGSEMSNSCVITNDETLLKRGVNSDLLRTKFSILNPELTYTLPKYQTACGVVDIIMHTVERYFTNNTTMEITDNISEALIKTVMKNGLILMDEPENYQARAEIMWSGSLSHNDLTGCRSDRGDWSVHKIEHELSGKYDVAHGAGLAALWASWARYVYKSNVQRFKSFAVNVMDVEENDKSIEKIVNEGIDKLESYFKQLDMPTRISDFDIEVSDEDIEEMALKATNNNTFFPGNIMKLELNDIKNIYHEAI